MYHSLEDLEVWKRACALAVKIYKALSKSKEYSLKDRMQCAAVSIASNIAEGAERSVKEFKHFLNIARGSSAELRTQTYIAAKIGIIEPRTMREIVSETKEISKMLFALSTSLK